MKAKELIRMMKKAGWEVERVHGGHYIMRKESQVEVISLHTKELPKGLEKSIRKRCGLQFLCEEVRTMR